MADSRLIYGFHAVTSRLRQKAAGVREVYLDQARGDHRSRDLARAAQERGKSIVKLIKDSKLKVQASIQGDALRVTGPKKDSLQEAIALVRKSVTDLPLQFKNFRD